MSYDPDQIFASVKLSSSKTTDVERQHCQWPGCDGHGEHRAPRSRERIREYRWFCIEHVRIYNRSWNYYEGMSDEEVEKLIRSDTTWNRPTWPLGDHPNDKSEGDPNVQYGPGFENISDPFGFFTEETSEKKAALKVQELTLSAAERKALSILDLDASVTTTELKARYKLLVKRYHPDATGGDKKSEERFKQISEAYEIIMDTLTIE